MVFLHFFGCLHLLFKDSIFLLNVIVHDSGKIFLVLGFAESLISLIKVCEVPSQSLRFTHLSEFWIFCQSNFLKVGIWLFPKKFIVFFIDVELLSVWVIIFHFMPFLALFRLKGWLWWFLFIDRLIYSFLFIIFSPFCFIAQDLIGFVYFFKSILVLPFVDIRMVYFG